MKREVDSLDVFCILAVVLVLAFFSCPAKGQEVPKQSIINLEKYQRQLVEEAKAKQRTQERWFWATQGVLVASSYMDIDSTMDALERCQKQNLSCQEANPILKPFVKDRQTAYLAMAGLDALQIYLNRQNFKNGGKLWIGTSIVSVGSHAYGYSVNVRVGY